MQMSADIATVFGERQVSEIDRVVEGWVVSTSLADESKQRGDGQYAVHETIEDLRFN